MTEGPHLNDPAFVAFRNAAQAYCTEVEAVEAETLGAADERALVLRLRTRVAALVPAAVALPDVALAPLADDLADIWRGLRSGLDWLDSGADPADVLWEWRFGFETHWGRHATHALRALDAAATSS